MCKEVSLGDAAFLDLVRHDGDLFAFVAPPCHVEDVTSRVTFRLTFFLGKRRQKIVNLLQIGFSRLVILYGS